MTGNKLGVGVGDGNHRLIKIIVLHACGAPKCASAGHITALGGGM